MRGLSLVVVALGAATNARAIERPLLVPAAGAAVETLDRTAPRRGLEVARPQREPDVAAATQPSAMAVRS